MNLEEKILSILEKAKNDIVNNIESANITASGKTQKSLSVIQRDGHILLIKGEGDSAPMSTLEIGRPGGGVPQGFYQIIKQWMTDKGISVGSEKENNTFAYFVSRKIEREGTVRNKNPRNDIYSNVVDGVLNDVKKEISEIIINSIKTN